MVIADGELGEDELLRLVASAERGSEHPLAGAIVRGAEREGRDVTEPDSFEAVAGHGLAASAGRRRLAVGNQGLLERYGVTLDGLPQRSGQLAAEARP